MALTVWKKYNIQTLINKTHPNTMLNGYGLTNLIPVYGAYVEYASYIAGGNGSDYITSDSMATVTAVGKYVIEQNPAPDIPWRAWCLNSYSTKYGTNNWGYNAQLVAQYAYIYSAGAYVSDVTAESGTYPTNGQSGSYWYVYQGLANVAPTISGDANVALANKNTPFTIEYSVNDADATNVLNVVERLNGIQTNTISNAPRNTNFTINITREILNSLPLNQQSTIQISVTDGVATTYKTITFTRTNSGPSITNSDKDLGQVARVGIAEKYTCHDVEGNTFTIVEKVNDIVLKNISGVDGTEYTIGIPEATWIIMPNGTHKYTITATDSLGASIIRTFTFAKKETVIESTGLTTIIPTDAAATKILLTPSWSGKENADIVIEVCNNAFDAVPTWENATSQTLLNKPYVFTNTTKTATKWGIDIRFKLTLKIGITDNVEFYGLGGAFE